MLFGHEVRRGTIGQVRVEVTNSEGVNGGYTRPEVDVAFDNYKPQKNWLEQYMCIETGIGSGSVYTLGVHIFATKEEAESALAKALAESEAV